MDFLFQMKNSINAKFKLQKTTSELKFYKTLLIEFALNFN